MDDPLFTYKILKPIILKKFNIAGIIFLDNPSVTPKKILSLFLIYGPIEFIKFAAAFLYWNILRNGRVKHLSQSKGIDYFTFSNEEMSLVEDLIVSSKPDLILSVNCNALLPNSIVDAAKFGGINLHQGSLPSYRGLMPIFYAQLNNEEAAGSTVHRINSRFDCGDIIIQERIEISSGENYVKIWNEINKIGSLNLIGVLDYISKNNDLPPSKPQIEKGKYYSLPPLRLVIHYFMMQNRERLKKLLTFKF